MAIWAASFRHEVAREHHRGGISGTASLGWHQVPGLQHELGHNLGLTHGGLFDGKNCKPNYLSIMSYSLQFSNFDPARPMDYSNAALPALNETALPATGGVGGPELGAHADMAARGDRTLA